MPAPWNYEIDRQVEREWEERTGQRPGPTPGYHCRHGKGYACRTCYAQPGDPDAPYLTPVNKRPGQAG